VILAFDSIVVTAGIRQPFAFQTSFGCGFTPVPQLMIGRFAFAARRGERIERTVSARLEQRAHDDLRLSRSAIVAVGLLALQGVSLPACWWVRLLCLVGPVLFMSRREPHVRLRDRFVQRLNTLLME